MANYNLDEIRKRLKASMSGKHVDPDEFKPDKAKSEIEPTRYRFFILPPLMKGDVLKSGTVAQSMDNFWIQHGNHWINNRPYACPRVYNNEDCAICTFGFEMYKTTDKKDTAKWAAIGKSFMPNTQYAVNVFFTHYKYNPEDLRGRVKYYNAPKTCLDKWSGCLLKDDCGDPEEPDAFGVFYDETNAFAFELQVMLQGDQNNYKTSKFLPNGGKPQPMIANVDGSPNTEQLAKLLRMRHNLFDKIQKPDAAKINQLLSTITDGNDPPSSGGGFDVSETVTPAAKTIVAVGAAVPGTKKQPAQVVQESDDDVISNTMAQPTNVLADDDAKSKSSVTVQSTTKPAPVTSKSTAAKAKKPDHDDALANEAPLADTPAKTVAKPVQVPVPVLADDDDSDIAGLLDQLRDDD